jgi:hypothetical protein
VVTNGVASGGGGAISVIVPVNAREKFYRLRQL